jgi:hypothetical protein
MRQSSGWLLVILVLGLTGCASLPGQLALPSALEATPAPAAASGPGVIGALAVSGSAVFLNGAFAKSGALVHDGDAVTTGADSSALVELAGGGSVQIDENTDPSFRFQLLTAGWCLVLDITSGHFLVDAGKGCTQVVTPDGSASLHSKVDVKVVNGQTTWTVLGGAIELAGFAVTVGALEGITTSKGKILRRTSLSMADLTELTEWQNKYSIPPMPPSVTSWLQRVPSLPGLPFNLP